VVPKGLCPPPQVGKPIRLHFWFLDCYAATQLALQVRQERIHVVRSNKVTRKPPTESNGTSPMDLGFEVTHKRTYTNKRGIKQNSNVKTHNMYDWQPFDTGIQFSILTLSI